MRKELREETGLECAKSQFLFYQDSLPTGPGEMHVVNFYFECSVSGTVRLNDESSAHTWIGAGDLVDYALVFNNDLGLQRYWNLAGVTDST